MCKRDGEKHADISHHGMVRDGLSTREKASTGEDFIAFPITPQHRSMRTPKRGVGGSNPLRDAIKGKSEIWLPYFCFLPRLIFGGVVREYNTEVNFL